MKLLIVDDEPATLQQRFHDLCFRRPDWKIETCPSGLTALEMLTDRVNAFDVALVNLQLKDVDGFRLRRMLLDRKSRVGVVFISLPFKATDQVATQFGVTAILPVRCNMGDLIGSLERAEKDSRVFKPREEYVSPLARLRFKLGGEEYSKLLCGDYQVGRDWNADIRIALPKVSRKHFELSRDYRERRYTLLDRSTNGVEVNGVRVSSYQALKHGDVLKVPGCEFTIYYLNVEEEDRDKTHTGEET